MMIFFLIGLLLVAGAVALMMRAVAMPRLRAEETITKIGDYGYSPGAGEVEQPSGLFGPFDGFAGVIGATITTKFGTQRAERARKQLIAAGMYNVEPRRLVGYQLLGGGALVAFWLWIMATTDFSPLFGIFGLVACGVVGYRLPMMIIDRRARTRLNEIEYDLPELIDLLVVAVEAGLGFSAALRAATDRLEGPLGQEMRLALQEQNMGLSVVEALKNVLTRVETPSVRSFVRSIVQGEQLGISIGQVLRNLAEEMRKRRKAAAEERAQKAPIKMLFPLIFLIFPAMFVILLGPAVFAFLEALG
jgi:tight adherence protein C